LVIPEWPITLSIAEASSKKKKEKEVSVAESEALFAFLLPSSSLVFDTVIDL